MALSALDVAEIERCIEATGVGVLLVHERALRRIIKQHKRLPGVGFDVPHAFAYVIPKTELLEIADEAELGRPAVGLADPVILLPRPAPDPFGDRNDTVLALWRGAFHSSVHAAIEKKRREGSLSEALIRSRIHQIGQTEFEEIRFVLRQDDALLPPEDDASAYVEFAATYLELRSFAPHTILSTFPALQDLSAIDRTLSLDVDDKKLFERTRPVNAPTDAELAARLGPVAETAVVAPVSRKSEAHSVPGAVSPAADRARARGNAIRSILLRVRSQGTEHAVEAELSSFMQRLASAIRWESPPALEWARTILPIVHMAPAAHRLPWNVEARLLFDLQKVCIDAERELYSVGVVEWALSGTKLPVKRPLPAQREMRKVKHIVAAIEKLPEVAIGERERGAIARLLWSLKKRAEDNVRETLGPRIEAALDEVGLAVHDIPSLVSRKKLVLELCDLIIANGEISLGHLRDSISRSSVKLENLHAAELWEGDPLLRADHILSRSLDGVYRRGEFYLRFLQKVSSIAFGTRGGRLASLYALLPLIGTYVILKGLQHTVGLVIRKITSGPDVEYLTWTTGVPTAIALFVLIHLGGVRRATWFALRFLGRLLHFVFIQGARWFFGLPLVHAFFASRPVRLVFRHAILPLPFTAAIGWPLLLSSATSGAVVLGTAAVGLFVAWNILLNSRLGLRIEEAAVDFIARRWRELKRRLIPGLIAACIALSRRALEGMDRLIYAVDEQLRFRQGEGSLSFLVKSVLGVAWFFATYAIRIAVNLFLEPEVNPVKHVPVVTVAAKIMIPYTLQIHRVLATPLEPVLGGYFTEPLVDFAIFVMPGFFGFLTWELSANWRLYDANRKPHIEAVRIGHHGETMAGFMKPGFHSGTIPKLYAKLRRAMAKRDRSALRHREELHHIEEAIHRFAERELVPLLAESRMWTGGPLEIGHVDVASNRVRVEMICPKLGRGGMKVAFEEQSGWLVGGITDRGFIDALDDRQRVAFENAIAGLYKMAGVEMVREQVTAAIGTLPYDITDTGLLVWPDRSYRTAVRYDLRTRGPLLQASIRVGLGALPPTLDASTIFFRDQPILWKDWVEAWAPRDVGPQRLVRGPSILGPPRLSMARLPDVAPTIAAAQ